MVRQKPGVSLAATTRAGAGAPIGIGPGGAQASTRYERSPVRPRSTGSTCARLNQRAMIAGPEYSGSRTCTKKGDRDSSRASVAGTSASGWIGNWKYMYEPWSKKTVRLAKRSQPSERSTRDTNICGFTESSPRIEKP